MVTNPFIRPDAALKERCRRIGQALQERRGTDGSAKPALFAPAVERYSPLVVIKTTAMERALPADMKKPVKSAKDYSLWYESLF